MDTNPKSQLPLGRSLFAAACGLLLVTGLARYSRGGDIESSTDSDTGFEVYRLHQGDMTASVVPEAGMNVFSIRQGDTELLRQPPDLGRLPGVSYGVPVLYPAPNRVAGAEFAFEGNTFRFPNNNGSNFIHGLVHSIAWRVVQREVTADSAKLVAEVTFPSGGGDEATGKPADFPLPHVLRLSVTVFADNVRWDYTVDNSSGSNTIPFGFALHPYFNYVSPRDQTTIQIPASHLMEAEQLLPTGKLLQLDNHPLDARRPRLLSELQADDVYFGMRASEPTRVEFTTSGLTVELLTSDEFTHLVLYTPRQPFFCVENQTCSTDAHNLARDGKQDVAHLQLCPPGQKRSGWVAYHLATEP